MKAEVECVFGVRGFGKTRLARALVAETPRLLAYDPFAEHDGWSCDTETAIDYLDALMARGRLDRFRVCVQSLTLVRGEALAEPEERFCRLAWAVATRAPELTVLLEEADLVAPPGRESVALRRLIAQGRHLGVRLISTSRRPAEVSRLLTSQAARFYVFRCHEPADVTFVRAITGAELPALTTLAEFHYYAVEGRIVREARL